MSVSKGKIMSVITLPRVKNLKIASQNRPKVLLFKFVKNHTELYLKIYQMPKLLFLTHF